MIVVRRRAAAGQDRHGSTPPHGPNPPNVHDINTDLARLRTRMSTERTLMSWNRTSLSLLSFGFTIYQFFKRFQESTAGASALRPEVPRNLGLALMVVGTLGSLIALWQHHQFVRYLSGDEFKAIATMEGFSPVDLIGLVDLLEHGIHPNDKGHALLEGLIRERLLKSAVI